MEAIFSEIDSFYIFLRLIEKNWKFNSYLRYSVITQGLMLIKMSERRSIDRKGNDYETSF